MLFSTTTQYPGPTTLITIHDLHHESHLHMPIWERELRDKQKRKMNERKWEKEQSSKDEREKRDQTEMREEQEKTEITVASL